MKIAFISQGKLFVKDGSNKPKEVSSEFGLNIVDTAVKIAKKHEWKQSGSGAQFRGAANPFGSSTVDDAAQTRVHFSAVSRGQKSTGITYALDTDDIGGLFRVGEKEDSELRIFHRQDININYIDQHSKEELLVCDITGPGGSSDIHYMKGSGRLSQLTEGDSVDMAPCWIPGEEEAFTYQSAGIGRDMNGYYVGLAPFSIEKMTLSGKLETLKEDENFDFLLPHFDSKGNLYYIKRPYEHPQGNRKSNPFEVIKDILLFPFRLLMVFYAFFNFMSVMLRGKPLANAGGHKRDEKKDKAMWLMGRIVDTEKAMKENKRKGNESIVPGNWELIKETPQGNTETLANGVISFDISNEDELIYSNGNKVFKLANGQKEVLFEDKMIQKIAII